MGIFLPDHYFDDIYSVTPEMLLSDGIKGVVLDIDNTLVPYEIPEPTEKVRQWLGSIESAGIKIAFVSNNHADRVNVFNLTLGYPAFPDSGKPLKKSCLPAIKAMGCRPCETAIIGDQVFTDVLAGRAAGMKKAILVKPIKDKTSLFFRFKRLLERPVISRYKRLERRRAGRLPGGRPNKEPG